MTDDPIICVLTVEIGEGRSGIVHIRAGDSAPSLARAFIREQALDESDSALLESLSDHIDANAREARQRYAEQVAERAARKAAAAASSAAQRPLPPQPAPAAPAALGSQANSVGSRRLSAASPSGSRHSAFPGGVGTRAMTGTEAQLEARYEAIARSVASMTAPDPAALRPERARSSAGAAGARHAASRESAGSAASARASATYTVQPPPMPPPPPQPPQAAQPPRSRAGDAAALSGPSVVPPPAPALPLPPAAQRPANPALYGRLHAEFKEKKARVDRLAEQLSRADRDAHIAERRKFGYRPPGERKQPGQPPAPGSVEQRLYDAARADAARREVGLAAQRAALAARAEGRWACPSCGAENEHTAVRCAQPVKSGSASVLFPARAGSSNGSSGGGNNSSASLVRVCGAPRPEAFHQPLISAHARNMPRTDILPPGDSVSAPRLPSAATVGVELYRRERELREQRARERAEAEVESQPFRPQIGQRSSELAEAARRRRLRALAAAGADAPRSTAAEESDDAERSAAHELLYADARHRQRAAELRAAGPAPWEDLTFQPDVDASRLRRRAGDSTESQAEEDGGRRRHARPEAELQALFERMHGRAAVARVRIEESRRRLEVAEKERMWRRRVSTDLADGGSGAAPSSLHEHTKKTQSSREAAIKAAHEEVERLARGRHVLLRSELLLEQRRHRCFAGIFRLLAQSVELSPAQRESEAAAQSAFERTIGGALGSAGPRGQLDSAEAARGGSAAFAAPFVLSQHDLAATLVALHAHALDDGKNSGGDGEQALNAAVAAAHATTLDVEAVWPACLAHPQLVALVGAVLARLRTRIASEQLEAQLRLVEPGDAVNATALPIVSFDDFIEPGARAPRLVQFGEFCDVAGRLLEEAGGGPHVYMLARRLARREAEHAAAAAAAAAAEAAEAPFAPKLDPRSRRLVELARGNDALSRQALGAPAPQVASIGDRLIAAGDIYNAQRDSREIAAIRAELEPRAMQPPRDELSQMARRIVREASAALRGSAPEFAAPLPGAVTDAASRHLAAAARAMGLRGEAPLPASVLSPPPPSKARAEALTTRADAGGDDMGESRGDDGESPPAIARTFIASRNFFARRDPDSTPPSASRSAVRKAPASAPRSGSRGDASSLGGAGGVGGVGGVGVNACTGSVRSPERFSSSLLEQYGYTPAAARVPSADASPVAGDVDGSLASLVAEAGELDRSAAQLQRLSQISLDALNQRIQRILSRS